MNAKRIVTLYMKALDGIKLPEGYWKRIARVNQLVLDKYNMDKGKTGEQKERIAYGPYFSEIRQILSKHFNEWPNQLLVELSELIPLKENMVIMTDADFKEIERKIIHEERQKIIQNVLYTVDVRKKPSIQDEAWANQFENKCEAFWYGQAQYRNDIISALNSVNTL